MAERPKPHRTEWNTRKKDDSQKKKRKEEIEGREAVQGGWNNKVWGERTECRR